MTSTELRTSFLEFFRERQHTIVPSASLMPASPNLLFTNAGMNQFVPIFLGERRPDASRLPGALPGLDTRAADTQKCIRAGGKHNDLDDVGLDTYHHTFFEMLGNWSFGDYFKAEAIQWAWELVVGTWGFPAERLYATVYRPGAGDPAEFDVEAHDHWAAHFTKAGLDPRIHIVDGNKKDNFWMMGDTGPCGPCSELHVDLTPDGATAGALVNAGDPRCIEIWNLVFIQFNANPDGSFSPLPARHVDTGMGFERVASIIQGTQNFTDFTNAKISNYETDIFRPLFDELGRLSGKRYASTLPRPGSTGDSDQERIDVAFRVIADHIRTLGFAIADGIQPGNTDRNYVLRRILRRAVRYGRTLGFHQPFFHKLVDVLARSMGGVFPEIRQKQQHVEDVLLREEVAFNKTLDKGLERFNAAFHTSVAEHNHKAITSSGKAVRIVLGSLVAEWSSSDLENPSNVEVIDLEGEFSLQLDALGLSLPIFPAKDAFELYDTYGFPLDLTELMARERGLGVDTAGFEELMGEQRERARAARKQEVIELSEVGTQEPTNFVGYESLATTAKVVEVAVLKDKTAVVLDTSAAYAEMGGQVGDSGVLERGAGFWRFGNTQKSGHTWLHMLEGADAPDVGAEVTVSVDVPRRRAIERHHTGTHLLHWALHEVVGADATQKGSFVGPDKLTFDFNSAALTPGQLADIERLVNERILENAPVSWSQTAYADVRERPDILQLFGEKYPETVRVVQIGGTPAALDGYSMELCGGTHLRATGEAGLLRLVSEGAVAAGVRRIEAVAGMPAHARTLERESLLAELAAKLNAPLPEALRRLEKLIDSNRELEKSLAALQQGAADAEIASLVAAHPDGPIIHQSTAASAPVLQDMLNALKKRRFPGLGFLVVDDGERLHLGVYSGEAARVAHPAGAFLQAVAPVAGGRGGGKPDMARGAAPDRSKLDALLDAARRQAG